MNHTKSTKNISRKFAGPKSFFKEFNLHCDHEYEPIKYVNNFPKYLERSLIILIAVILIASLVIHSKWMMPNHDVAWILVEAQNLLSGGRFYYDIQELNPPLIVLFSCPGVIIAHLASIDVWAGLMIWIHILIIVSLFLALPTLKWISIDQSPLIFPLIIYFISILVPNYHFGQREHLTIILSAPALLLFFAQESGRISRSSEIIFLWLVGSIGFLIKPFFIILPLLLIMMRAIRKRDWRCLFGLESLILIISALIYIAMIFIKYPEWLISAKLASQLYFSYNISFIESLWSFRYSIISLFLVFFVLTTSSQTKSQRVFCLYIIFSALIFLVLAIVQRKGFNYHAIPVTALLVIASGYLSLELITIKLSAQLKNWRTDLGALMLGCALVVLSFRTLAGPGFTSLSEFIHSDFPTTVARHANNRSWFAMSRGGLIPLSPSLLLIDGFVGQRSSLQWMVPGIVMLSLGSPDEKIQAEKLRKLNTRNLLEDIKRYRPFLIGVEKTPDGVMTVPFDLLDFYSQDEGFRQIWREYSQVDDIEGWRFYERKKT